MLFLAEATGIASPSSTPYSGAVRIPFPDLRSLREQTAATNGRYARSRSIVPPERWPEIAFVARAEGLRAAAERFGVSHETIRRIVQRIDACHLDAVRDAAD